MKKLFIWLIPRLPNWFLNLVIRFFSQFSYRLDGNPNEWLERPYLNPLSLDCDGWRDFRCGSIRGIYFTKNRTFNIVAIQNTKSGNDHFKKTLEWFEKSARREHFKIAFLETMNPKLGKRLLSLGYSQMGDNFVKQY